MKKLNKSLKTFFRLLIIFVLLTLFLRAFFLGAFQIPTSSMANTLLPGDFIIVNLAAYKFKTPSYFPILGFSIPSVTLLDLAEPKVNDVVIFGFPSIAENSEQYYSANLVKRIAAGPGDTLQILDKRIYYNGSELSLTENVLRSSQNIKPEGEEDEGIFYSGSGWNNHNYGPLIVPARGDTININLENIHIWKQLIVFEYGKRVVREEGSVITIEGKPVRDYIVKKDHYFVIGDNFSNSLDSRHFGFINENMIIGKAIFIYWSLDKIKLSNGIFSGIRWERIFRGI